MELLEAMVESGVAVLTRGTVLDIRPQGAVVSLADGRVLDCDVLETGAGPLRLAAENTVIVWQGSACDRAVVLGRIATARPEAVQPVPDELVVEARRNLTLKCGSGSIAIREDGKILIKGKDLVSHATRLNRIKGGAVQIN
jgi:hypothetical protein